MLTHFENEAKFVSRGCSETDAKNAVRVARLYINFLDVTTSDKTVAAILAQAVLMASPA